MSGTTVHSLVSTATGIASPSVDFFLACCDRGGLRPSGWAPRTLADEIQCLKDEIWKDVDPALDLGDGTPFGQLIAIFAGKLQSLNDLGQAVYDGIDPNNASGNLLVNLCALSGTRPQVATHSTVVGTLTLGPSTTVHAGAVAAVAGDPTNTWVLTSDAVNPETSTQPVNGLFQSTLPGIFRAGATTLTVIQTPTIGWTAVSNASDSVDGLAADDDPSLRAKRVKELSGEGTSNVDAIRARILELPDIKQAFVFQNKTPVGPDANGLPGKSLRGIYWDGAGAPQDTAVLAQLIWDNKPAGIQAFGNLTFEAHDSTGAEQDVQFDRADEKPLYLTLTTTPAPNKTIGAPERALIREALRDWAVANLNLGVDVIALPLRTAALGGVAAGLSSDIPTFALGFAPSPVGTVNLPVSSLQIATLATTNISVDGTFS